MIQPLLLDVIEGEFSEDYEAWVAQAKNGKFLVIPDHQFPGRMPVRFFLSEADARRVIDAVLNVKPELSSVGLRPIKVRLLDSLRSIAKDTDPNRADSFVVQSPNEVYEFVTSMKTRTIH